MFRPALLVAGCIALVAASSNVSAHESKEKESRLLRETRFGPIVGVDDSDTSGTYAWKGVPFAKPPTGELRWKAPADPDRWRQPKLTQNFGNACVQYGRIYGPGANNRYDQTIATTLNQAVGQEDCLYLNIWRPATHRGDLPVIVFIHGASNVYAMLTSPLAVNAKPKLFHRAAAFSGGISLASNLPPGSIPTLNPAPVYLAQGNALLTNLVIADGLASDTASAQAYIAAHSSAEVAAYLRSKTPSVLLFTLLTKLAPLGLAGSGPIPDGAVLPVDPIAAIGAGHYVKVPFLASNTRDEAKLFPTFLALSPALGGVSGRLVTDAQLFNIQLGYHPNAAPQIAIEQWVPSVYLPVATPVTGFNARTDLLNRIFFIASRDNVLNTLKAQQDEVWYYRFDWDREPAPFNDIYGAAHAFDLAFLFGNFGPSLFSNIANSNANQPGRLELSHAMMRSLAAFARRGDPNSRSLGVHWPAWPATLLFDASDTDAQISVQ